jgi:hypothetical protein
MIYMAGLIVFIYNLWMTAKKGGSLAAQTTAAEGRA